MGDIGGSWMGAQQALPSRGSIKAVMRISLPLTLVPSVTMAMSPGALGLEEALGRLQVPLQELGPQPALLAVAPGDLLGGHS